MIFTAPLFLLALLPWAALAIYLMIGRRRRVAVPFVELWKVPIKPRRTTRAVHVPPASVVLILVALLAVVLAAGGPAVKRAPLDATAQEPPATRPARNVGIVHLAVRERPAKQLHLRLANDAKEPRIGVRMISGGRVVLERFLDLPAEGTRDYFLDFDAELDPRASVELLGNDDVDWDDRVVLVRERPWPRLEPRAAMPETVQRVLDAYSRHRPTSDGSPTVALLTAGGDVPTDAAVLVAPAADARAPEARGTTIVPHPITAGVDALAGLVADAAVSDPPTGAAWSTLISIGGRPALSVRESPARQVHVGFHSGALAASPEFVYLWTNILDWVGGSAHGELVARPQERPAPDAKASTTEPQRPRLLRLDRLVLLAALALVLLSALIWKRSPEHGATNTPT
jgi:hypothetical protein